MFNCVNDSSIININGGIRLRITVPISIAKYLKSLPLEIREKLIDEAVKEKLERKNIKSNLNKRLKLVLGMIELD